MFESRVATLQEWTSALAVGLEAGSDRERLELIRALEELTCAAAAAQAVLGAEFDESQRARQR
jgi:2-oxo-4-hydroxy-4-carboxy--5-ureidoimidazoline (OHCU) decarboxylase